MVAIARGYRYRLFAIAPIERGIYAPQKAYRYSLVLHRNQCIIWVELAIFFEVKPCKYSNYFYNIQKHPHC